MVNETKKIMGDDGIRVTATCVRVPVFHGHSKTVNVETEAKLSAEEARRILEGSPSVIVVDDPKNLKYPMPIMSDQQDTTFVGRIREDFSIDNGLNLRIVSNNIRTGAALNAVQIAEELMRRDLVTTEKAPASTARLS